RGRTILIPAALLLGLASGFISGIAAGGGMIAIPGMIFMGLSPSTAIATNILITASSVSSGFRYHQSKIIQRQYTIPFLWLSFLGGIVGSKLLLRIDGQTMQQIFGMMCLCLAPFVAFKRNSIAKNHGKISSFIGLVLIFMTCVFAALFGTGGGIFMVYILSYFYGMSIMEANANAKIISLGGALSMIVIFLHAGIINFTAGIPLMIGSAIGGYIGAHTALKRGEKIVKTVFFLVVVVSGLKLLLF
ncbi:sulfite exporter TauE/SafE family protein, partial [Candidatus Saccharibacteria bacterium]|nr:sulfite exporter TauE/SafE family protein [Candidatus Saccharibacteria bacterium]